jgi:hypothetical protein
MFRAFQIENRSWAPYILLTFSCDPLRTSDKNDLFDIVRPKKVVKREEKKFNNFIHKIYNTQTKKRSVKIEYYTTVVLINHESGKRKTHRELMNEDFFSEYKSIRHGEFCYSYFWDYRGYPPKPYWHVDNYIKYELLIYKPLNFIQLERKFWQGETYTKANHTKNLNARTRVSSESETIAESAHDILEKEFCVPFGPYWWNNTDDIRRMYSIECHPERLYSYACIFYNENSFEHSLELERICWPFNSRNDVSHKLPTMEDGSDPEHTVTKTLDVNSAPTCEPEGIFNSESGLPNIVET